MAKITEIIKREKLTLIGAAVGIAAGLLYWKFVGCAGGSCPITSSPWSSSLWGAVLGALIFSMFKKKDKGNEI